LFNLLSADNEQQQKLCSTETIENLKISCTKFDGVHTVTS